MLKKSSAEIFFLTGFSVNRYVYACIGKVRGNSLLSCPLLILFSNEVVKGRRGGGEKKMARFFSIIGARVILHLFFSVFFALIFFLNV